MIFTLTDRNYNVIDAYESEDYLIGKYIGNIIQSLDLEVLITSENSEKWVEGNYIMCEDSDGYKYWFTIYIASDALRNSYKTLKCYSGTIDIVLEDANSIIKPDVSQPFNYYFEKIFYDTGIEIGINEISDLTRRLEFTSENATNAEMLQYVLNGFDNAEADLAVEFNGSIPTKLILNVFKRIGNREPQSLLSDEDSSLTHLKRSGTISELATCLNPVGQNIGDTDTPVTLVGKYYEELDDDGNIIYYSPKESPRVFSVRAREQFYVQLPNKQNGEFDGYINRRYQSQASSQDSLWSQSLSQLKKIDNPSVEYEAKGYINCRIGDTIQIVSNEMKPPVMISARVLEYKFNDDDPSRNEYTFGNYQTLESNIDELAKMMAELKKTIIVITEQVVDYALSDSGIEPPSVGWSDSYIPPIIGQWLWTRTTTSLSNGDQTVGYSVSRIGEDGKNGQAGEDGYTPIKGIDYFDGEDGLPGANGIGIKTTVVQYKAHTSGTTAPTGTWSSTVPTVSASQYLWTRTVITYDDDTSTTAYSVGLMGAQGPKGDTGATGNGVSSTTLHYVDSTSGIEIPSSGWSTTIPTVTAGNYLWTRTTFTMTNGSTTYTYSVGRMGEPTGITVSTTAPNSPFTGMLWRNTGTDVGMINGATYRWTGSAWELYIFNAANISAETISTISANLGTVTAGIIKSSDGSVEFNLGTKTLKLGDYFLFDTTGLSLKGVLNMDKDLFMIAPNGFKMNGLHGRMTNGTQGVHQLYIGYDPNGDGSASSYGQFFIGHPEATATSMYFAGNLNLGNVLRLKSTIEMENNTAIRAKDTGAVLRRLLLKGSDNWTHINPDTHGRTQIWGVTELTTLNVSGTKNAVHVTRDGVRATPAYEMAESYLGDMGESITDESNTVAIPIEELFSDTVNLDVPYQVFLQSYSEGRVWVSERNGDNFVVNSDIPNVPFAWEIKAKRRGYENDRLTLDETYDNQRIKQTAAFAGEHVELLEELD